MLLKNVLLVCVAFAWVSCSDSPPVAPVDKAASPVGKAASETVAVTPEGEADLDPGQFADPGLEAAVREALNKEPSDDLTEADLASLKALDATNRSIESLDGLEHVTALKSLLLDGNAISDEDLHVLSPLTELTALHLSTNAISIVSALSTLTNLETLYLSANVISDVRGLSGLTSLRELYLIANKISDVRALVDLAQDEDSKLDVLYLAHNSLDYRDNADIQALIDAGVTLDITPFSLRPGEFFDVKLEAAVRAQLNIPTRDLTATDLTSLTLLDAKDKMRRP